MVWPECKLDVTKEVALLWGHQLVCPSASVLCKAGGGIRETYGVVCVRCRASGELVIENGVVVLEPTYITEPCSLTYNEQRSVT